MIETGILLEHNIKTYEDAQRILDEYGRVVIVQPTGTGKSYIMMQFMHDYKDKWKVIVAPSKFFLDRLKRNKYWVDDKTITLTYAWLVNNLDNLREKIEKLGVDIDDIGFIAFDEIHRAGAVKWSEAFNVLTGLNNKAKVLGLTATPIRYNDKKDVITSMFRGKSINNLSFEQAIAKGILPQLTYVIGMLHISTDIQYLEKIVNENKAYNILHKYIQDVKDSWNFDEYFIGLMNKYLDKDGDTHKHIVFTHSIAEADRIEHSIKKYFTKVYPDTHVNIYKMHCGLSNKVNKQTIEEFQSSQREVSIALVVNMLNESFHVEDVESIILLRGTNSPSAYIQQIGRALCVNGKSPIIFDFVDNIYSVGEVFKRFNISRKHSKVEKIDFDGEKWFSDKTSLYERTMRKKTKSFIVDKSIGNGIFKEVMDEAYEIESKISYIMTLCNTVTKSTMELFSDYINETQCNTIYGITDKDKFNWCKWVLEHKYSKGLLTSEKEVYTKYSDVTQLSEYIMYTAGLKWHEFYSAIIRGEATESQIKSFKNYNIDKYLRNIIGKGVADKLRQIGIEIDITNNEEELRKLYKKHQNNIKETVQTRIGWLTEENIRRNPFLYSKTLHSIENMLASVKSPTKVIPDKELSNLIAYKYTMCIKARLDKFIEENNIRVDDMLYIDELRTTDKLLKRISKNETYIDSMDELKQYDKLFLHKDSFDSLPDVVVEFIKFRSFNTFDRVKRNIFKACRLFEITNRIIEKTNYKLINDTITNEDIIEFRELMHDINKDYADYDWCNEIKNEINTVNELINHLQKYITGDNTANSIQYIMDYIESIKAKEKVERIKRDYIDGFAIENETQNSIVRRLSIINNFDGILSSSDLKDIVNIANVIKQEYIEDDCNDTSIYNILVNSVAFLKLLLKSNELSDESAIISKEIKKIIGYTMNQYDLAINNAEMQYYSEYKMIVDYIDSLNPEETISLAGYTLGIQDRKFYLRTLYKMKSGEYLTSKDRDRAFKLVDSNCTKTLAIFLENEQMCNKVKLFDYFNTVTRDKLA